ncbi:MAG: arginine--tRNA ligase [Spirochaetaceae bacterium]
MLELKSEWKSIIIEALQERAIEQSIEIVDIEKRLLIQTPPNASQGDLCFPMFPFAKDFKESPISLAKGIAGLINGSGNIKVEGAYINIFIDREKLFADVINNVLTLGSDYGKNETLKGQKIMIEFSSPNTNKPLHLGHLRNDILGESNARILKNNGAEVKKVNLINNRGIHICKSMLAYMEFGNGTTPESTGLKGDHFVGNYYVKYNEWSKTDSSAEVKAQKLLQQWEAGDTEVLNLWKKMNNWTLEGVNQTYKNTGISFDSYYYEDETYLAGKEIVLEGLENGTFYKDEDGSIRCDLKDIDLDNKVLLRSDGTSVYVTQDLGTAIKRRDDFEFNRLIYVVASEQDYHFKILFHLLKKMGYEWADMLHHLSYGMVVLPDGKMKSREGTVVDADTLLESLETIAIDEINSRDRLDDKVDIKETAHNIVLAALNYYLLHISTYKDIMFNPKESLAFSGNTGPYMQYTGARITTLINKFSTMDTAGYKLKPQLLTSDEAWELIKIVANYPSVIELAAKDLNPSVLTTYLYNLCKTYSRFYHENQILNNEDKNLDFSRIELSKVVLQVLKNIFYLLNIPYLEKM